MTCKSPSLRPAGPDQTVCTSELPIQLAATGTTGQWQPSTGTFLPSDLNMNATYMPSAAEITAGTVQLIINTINNGLCPAGADTLDITINPGPTVSAGPDQTICKNVPSVTLAGTKNAIAAGITWSTVSSSGSFDNNTLLGATYTPSAADYAAGIATLAITSNGHPGCNPVRDTMRIFITPAPTLSLGSDLTRCGDVGTVTISSTVATNNNTIAWAIISGAGSITNAATNNPTYNLGAETIPGTITLQATVTPLPAAGTCNNLSRNININLTPIPNVSAGSNTNSCLTNPNAALNGSVTVATGGTWSTSGTGSFSPNTSTLNATYVPSTADLLLPSVNLTLTTTGNGQCAAYNNAITLTFDLLPTISTSPDRLVICSGNTVTFTSVITNATGVAWTNNGGDGTFNTPTSAITVYTPGPNDIANGGMIITGTSTGVTSCIHDVKNVAIGIVPSPVASVNAGFDQIVCADIDTIQLNGFIAVALGGQWSASSGLGLFLPNTTDLSAKYIPDPSDKVGGNSITITLSSTGNGICAPSADDMLINFTPIPTVSAGPDMIICADSAFIQLTPTITTATGGVWTTSGDPNAFAPSPSTVNAIYTPTANDIANGSIGFTLTTTGNGTCKAYNNSLAVTITPKPTIAIGPDLNICANATSVNLNASTTVATSTTWTTSGGGGFAPNPNNASLYTVVPSDTTAKSIIVFGQSTNQGACKPTFDTLTINFQSTPIADAGPDIASCANIPSISLLVGKVYNATGGIWSSSGTGNFSNPITQLSNVYVPSPNDKTLGTVTLTLSTTGNGKCPAILDQLLVSIAPSPIVTANPAILCDTLAGAALSGSVTNALGGTWSSSLPGGTFAPNANSPTGVTYFPGPNEVLVGRAILTLTSTGNGTCNPETQTINVVIEPLPIANAGPDQFVCQNGLITLSAFTQPSVTYQWATSAGPVFANTPNTNVNVPALTRYVLTATDAKGCSVNDTTQVDVFTMPTFNILPNPACFDRNLVLQSNPAPIPAVNGVFQWYRNNQIINGENKVFISPATPGTYKIEYAYGTCSSDASALVNPPPSIISEDVIACNNSNTILTVTNLANTTYSWTFNGNPIGGGTNNINALTSPNDTSLYYVTVTDNATTCSVLDSIYLIGIPTPIVPALDSTSCKGLEVTLSATPTNITDLDRFLKLTYGWTQEGNILNNTSSSLTVNQAGQYIGTVTIDRCPGSGINNIGFSEYPTGGLPENQKYCKELDNQVILDAGLAFKYLWNTGNPADTLRTLTVSPEVNTVYKVTLTNEFNCSVSDSIAIRNICEPRVFNPNAFNPNCTNCGNNNVFQVYGAYIGKYKITIFNRWGEVIFMSEDINVSWDGNYLRELMPVGVYPFIIYYEGKDEYAYIKNTIKGKVTLLR
jgi:gliding motility-associated-like protein